MIFINTSKKVQIFSDHKTVFDYVSNLENDKFWRKEVNSTTMDCKPQIGSVAIEDSFLSKKTPSNVLNLKCIKFIKNEKIIYQTLTDSSFFLKTIRQVEPITENRSLVTYTIKFDKSIVKHGLGFSLPKFIIYLITKRNMRIYLQNLKSILEYQNSSEAKILSM